MTERTIVVPLEEADFTAEGGVDSKRVSYRAVLLAAREGIKLEDVEGTGCELTTGLDGDGREVLLAVLSYKPKRRRRSLLGVRWPLRWS